MMFLKEILRKQIRGKKNSNSQSRSKQSRSGVSSSISLGTATTPVESASSDRSPEQRSSTSGSPDQKEETIASRDTRSGVATQFKGTSATGLRKQLVIGLDFGTAFTKVVVGEERLRIAIPLQGIGEKQQDYLLPTVFWAAQNGACSLDPGSGVAHEDLKMSLIEGNFSTDVLFDTTVYLALVLRRVRAYLFVHKKGIYGNSHIDWLLNVGLPTDSFHSEKLNEAYKSIVGAAWLVSAQPGDIYRAQVVKILEKKKRYESADSLNTLHPESISLFPEFVAQVTGYVRSPMRQSDLHLLVDVGAGTLDVTIFNVHQKDDEDVFPILAKAVEPLGTRFLTKHRFKNDTNGQGIKFSAYDLIPDEDEFAELLGISVACLQDLDMPFRKKVRKLVSDLLVYTKEKRYPKARCWEDGVPIFFCGGGVNCDFYTEAFYSKYEKVLGFPLKKMKLPKPDQLEAKGITEAEYDRLSVAYGLSFDPFDIGEIVKEGDIDDVTEEAGSVTGMCRRCNGNGGLHRACNSCGGRGFIL